MWQLDDDVDKRDERLIGAEDICTAMLVMQYVALKTPFMDRYTAVMAKQHTVLQTGDRLRDADGAARDAGDGAHGTARKCS